jgi:hypothetical protein
MSCQVFCTVLRLNYRNTRNFGILQYTEPDGVWYTSNQASKLDRADIYESLNRYERTRPLHQKPKELIKQRYEGYGTRNRLIELLELCHQP